MLRALSLTLALFTFLTAASLARAQQIHLPPAVSQSQGMGAPPVTSGNDAQKQQAQAANLQRQEEIRRDAEKMFQLTADLKDYLQKNDQRVMSLDAIKKAEQIEKLAHSVKSKMKQSF
jgi:TolA-binding protein